VQHSAPVIVVGSGSSGQVRVEGKERGGQSKQLISKESVKKLH